MLRVRDAASAADRFKTKAGAAAGEYAKGVTGAGQAWETGAAAGEQNYSDGVQAAISRGAYGKGVKGSGGGYYEDRAKTLGATRYAPGVAAGANNYQEGVAPFLDVMRNATLSPRRPKGDPGNITRVQEIANLNRQTKLRRA